METIWAKPVDLKTALKLTTRLGDVLGEILNAFKPKEKIVRTDRKRTSDDSNTEGAAKRIQEIKESSKRFKSVITQFVKTFVLYILYKNP